MKTEQDIFEAAADLPEPARHAYLDQACARQPEMRARLEALLRSHDATGFMEENAVAAERPQLQAEWAPSQPEEAGQHIGRYKLLEQIGEGGFGIVWVAEQLEPVRRRVALKIIKPGMDSREVIARFEQERQALAMMDHSNIAKVFDAGAMENGRPFFVMELVRGVKITEYCDEANLPTTDRLKLFITVCQAVQHAHQKGIIHRDLKPSNILVTPGDDGEPVPKVIDFGVAKAIQEHSLTDGTVYTQFEQMIGTPAYMSPEQAGLGPMDIDTRSDVYSLGVLLYELLTGRPPFDPKELLRAGLDEMRRIIREVEPPKPSTRRTQLKMAIPKSGKTNSASRIPHSAIDQDLDWMVMKALEKDRARRYETANGLARDIQRFLNDEPVSAGPPSAAYRIRKFARRNKVALLVTSTIAATLVAATIVSIWQAYRATSAEKLANQKTTDEKLAREDAEAISEFLIEVFESPNPHRDGRAITAVELLERGATKAEKDLAAQPYRRARLQETLGRTYDALGLATEAIAQHEKVRDYYRDAVGLAHPNTIGAMHNLAKSYNDAGRKAEGLKLQEEVLELNLKVNGPEHPSTLSAMHNLACEYHGGNKVKALKLREEVLALRRKVSGLEHPDTLTAQLNLAISYFDAGRRDEAIRMEEEVVILSSKVNGPEHTVTLGAMYYLGSCYEDVGRLEQGFNLREKVLELCLKVLGPEHPDTLSAMAQFAYSCFLNGRLTEKAVKLAQDVLAQHEKLNRPEEESARVMRILAYLYEGSGRRDEALGLREEVLAIRRKVNGPGHPATLRAMQDLAISYFDAGRRDEALKLREDALLLSRKVNGPENRDSLGAMRNLARSLAARRGDEARTLLEEVLRLSRKVLGPEHSDTLLAGHNLATSYFEAGRQEESLELRREVLEISKKSRRPEHPDTLNAMTSLAISYAAAARLPEAIELQEESLAIERRVLPKNHEYFERALKNLGELYEKDGNKAKSEALRIELTTLASPVASSPAPVSESKTAAEPKPTPEAPSDCETLVASNSEWKWLHPTDGKDPADNVPGFHANFSLPDFDDSAWQTGLDSDEADSGFGYGLSFKGVNIGKPDDVKHRRAAWFRHKFTSDKEHLNLELRCRFDDGIIVYLDGKEVIRDNVAAGADSWQLPSLTAMDRDNDSVTHRYAITGPLAAGTHILAISVHNTGQPSTDLRLGGISLVAVKPATTEK